MIPITPEMIAQGMKVIEGIANIAVDFINKLKEKQEAASQAVKDRAAAALNIVKAWSDTYATAFNAVTTGSSAPAYAWIKAKQKYTLDNPLPLTKQEKITGKNGYFFDFKKVGNTWNCEFIKRIDGVNTVIDTKTFQDSPIFNAGSNASAVGKPYTIGTTILLPNNYAVDFTNANFDTSLYNRAIGFVMGQAGQTLTDSEVEKWKSPTVETTTTVQTTQTTPDSQPNKGMDSGTKSKLLLYGGIGLGVLVVILVVSMSGKKKTKA